MIDINIIRKQPEKIKKIIESGRSDPAKADIDKWLELDSKRSELIQKRDELRESRNEISKGLDGKPDEKTIAKVKVLKDQTEKIEVELNDIEVKWQEILNWVPNIPISDEAMPEGDGEEDNPIDKVWIPELGYIFENVKGDDRDPQHVGGFSVEMPDRSLHWDSSLREPKHHLDLGSKLGLIDVEQSAKVSGSRFSYLLGDLVRMQYAIQQMVFNELLRRGFTPIIPPLMVKERSLYGTSHFPEGKDQVYKIDSENIEDKNELYLVGSSEPTNFSYFMDKVFDESELPLKVFAYTPCFRSEVGSWGKDVKGIKRVHQFDKIEMNAVCSPEQSGEVFSEFLSINEWLLQSLQIPYRLTRKCTGDAGYHASAEQIDPEAWLPGQKEFIELGTDTNTTDFQARRLNIKYQTKDRSKDFVHTVNDTCVAMGRMLIAIMDNYQQSDGSIKVPEVLIPFMGKEVITK
jgi:seryl-tRNA synthetase